MCSEGCRFFYLKGASRSQQFIYNCLCCLKGVYNVLGVCSSKGTVEKKQRVFEGNNIHSEAKKMYSEICTDF